MGQKLYLIMNQEDIEKSSLYVSVIVLLVLLCETGPNLPDLLMYVYAETAARVAFRSARRFSGGLVCRVPENEVRRY